MDLSEGPSLRPKHQASTATREKPQGAFGVHDTLRYGFAAAKDGLAPAHPLEQSEANYVANQEAMMFRTLRDTQGLYAPLSLQMERKLVSRIQRLPPLQSSMIALETLTGNDERLSIEEALNPLSNSVVEVDGRAVMEKRLKMT